MTRLSIDAARDALAAVSDATASEQALSEQAMALYQEGQFGAAAERFRRVLEKRPTAAGMHHNLAVSLARQGKLAEAIESFHRALQLRPRLADIHRNLALALSQAGRLQEAEAAYREAVRLKPRGATAVFELANLLRTTKRSAEALVEFERAVRLRPKHADSYHGLGLTLVDLKRRGDAVAAFQQALRLKPAFPEAVNSLGILLAEEGKLDAAIALYREQLRHNPDSVSTMNNLGVALAGLRRYSEAVNCYREALKIDPHYASLHNNLGNSLRALGRLDEAEASLEQAIRLKPGYPEAYNNLGIVSIQKGCTHEAIARYNHAIHLMADYPEPHLNRSLAWLGLGDFAQGAPEYEWRWRGKGVIERRFRQPRLDGNRFRGQRVLLHYEQGIGDTIQFIRYAEMLKRGGATVLLQPHEALLGVVASCPWIDEIVAPGETLPAFDAHAPLLSLPLVFETRLETIPGRVPYLYAEPELKKRWRERLRTHQGFKVGIVWQGSPHHRSDHLRSIALSEFAVLATIPGVRLFSLQKGFGREQFDAPTAPRSMIDLGNELDDFRDTAAALANLDLLISCDTSVAHLAGALGVPVWTAIQFAADWRWLRSREDTPWYPTMRLFRQQTSGDWAEVFQRIRHALEEKAAASTRAPALGRIADRASARAYQKAGIQLHRSKEFAAAAEYFRRAIDCDDQWSAAHHNLGVTLAVMKRLDEAIPALRRAAELAPKSAEVWANLGTAFLERENYRLAAEALERARVYGHLGVDSHNNLGVALDALGKSDEAVSMYRRAIQLDPGFTKAHVNLSAVLLRQGHFAEGWHEQSWRSRASGRTMPRWNGEELRGGSILLHADAGLEAPIRFIRYAPLLEQGGARVLLESASGLAPLFAGFAGVSGVVPAHAASVDADYHCPLISLPWMLRHVSTGIPRPPYLSPDRGRQRFWKRKLAAHRQCRVGIAGGSGADVEPFQGMQGVCPVELATISDQAGTKVFLAAADVEGAGEHHEIDDSNLPALLQNLDLLITADQELAEIAGALDIPVWLGISVATDAWWTAANVTAWYPSMQIYRSDTTNLGQFFQAMALALRERVASLASTGWSDHEDVVTIAAAE